MPIAYILGLIAAREDVQPRACGTRGRLVDGSFNAYGVRPLPDGFVVFYTAACRQRTQTEAIEAYVRFEMNGLSWERADSGSAPAPVALTGVPVLSAVRVDNSAQGGYALISGQVYTNGVAAVLVRFADGQVVSGRPNGERFALLVAAAVQPCELELRNRWGRVMYREDLSQRPTAAMGSC